MTGRLCLPLKVSIISTTGRRVGWPRIESPAGCFVLELATFFFGRFGLTFEEDGDVDDELFVVDVEFGFD